MIPLAILTIITGFHYYEVQTDYSRFRNVPADFRERIERAYNVAARLFIISALALAVCAGKMIAEI